MGRLGARLIALIAALLILDAAAGEESEIPSQLLDKEAEALLRMSHATAAVRLQADARLVAPLIQADIQQLVDELAIAAETGIRHQLYLLNNAQVNLFTLPTGEIFVLTGFIDIVDNRDELAFGLAHEIAHFKLNHGRSQMRASIKVRKDAEVSAAILSTVVATAVASYVGLTLSGLYSGPASAAPLFDKLVASQAAAYVGRVAAKIPTALVLQSAASTLGDYSQEQEFEADRLGLLIMKRAGYDPDAAVKVMKKFPDLWHRPK